MRGLLAGGLCPNLAAGYVLGMLPLLPVLIAAVCPGLQPPGPQPGEGAGGEPLGFSTLLEDLVDLDRLWRAPPGGELVVQFSSYDRKSDAGPQAGDDWFANADRGHYLRTEEHDGVVEHVMVDVAGPGAVVRIWSANPSGELMFYLDGEPKPRWRVGFQELTSGSFAPFLEPLAGVRARGANFHVPIPFARHLKITSTADDFYYQVNVRRFPPGTEVRSFATPQIQQNLARIDEVRDRLAAAGATEVAGEGIVRRRFAGAHGMKAGKGQGTMWKVRLLGPTIVRELRLKLRPKTEPGLLPDLLRSVVVRAEVDGERVIEAPVSDFFGSAPAFAPYSGLAVGVTEDGWGYCRFPMPVDQVLELHLDYEDLPCDVSFDISTAEQPGALPPGALRFHTTWNLARDLPTRPFKDHRVLDVAGAGRFVGCSLTVRNPTKAWWGEGDEKFYVDGEDFPSTFGTGTEDYFGYAWCCPDAFSSPFHAQPQCDGPANFGYTSVERQQIADDVPFHESFRFDLEVWHWQDVVVDYASTAWWYGSPGARATAPALPPREARLPVAMQPPVAFSATGALEAESLKVVSLTGGERRTQDMAAFPGGKWSRDTQLWWIEGQPGDRLTLELPVARTGRQGVAIVLTKARDYGIVQVHLNGKKLGDPIDLYSPDVVLTPVLTLGEVELEEGKAQLVLEIVGRNEKAEARYMVGVDYLLVN